jgi:LPXTG-site transpeptidase (sortase) family protein
MASARVARASTEPARGAAPARRQAGFDPLRATFMLFIAAGVLLIVSFFYATSESMAAQQRLDQMWRSQVHVPPVTPLVVPVHFKHPVNGVDFAISIPKLHYFAAVKEGISSTVLWDGPGHYPQTRWPGDPGTVGVAAHNEYWIDFPKLVAGDEVDLQTRYGNYRYRITGSRVVSPSDRSVLVPDAAGYHLTLTTCWPTWAGIFATQRYVIFTEQFWPLTVKPGNT